MSCERDGGVERGLAAERRQQRVGTLLRDDRFDELRRDRLDVGAVGELRVRHDRRRVRVHEDDPEAVLAQDLARLRAGVVELARLPDDDRARADDQDRFEVGLVAALRLDQHPRCADPDERRATTPRGAEQPRCPTRRRPTAAARRRARRRAARGRPAPRRRRHRSDGTATTAARRSPHALLQLVDVDRRSRAVAHDGELARRRTRRRSPSSKRSSQSSPCPASTGRSAAG